MLDMPEAPGDSSRTTQHGEAQKRWGRIVPALARSLAVGEEVQYSRHQLSLERVMCCNLLRTIYRLVRGALKPDVLYCVALHLNG